MLLLYFPYSFRDVNSSRYPQHLIASIAPVLIRSTLLAKAVGNVKLTRKEIERRVPDSLCLPYMPEPFCTKHDGTDRYHL